MITTRYSVGRALSQSQAGLHVCRSCRKQLSRTGSSIQQQRFSSTDELPTTEIVRRKLWGTDNPPGLKDPYGGPSFLEKRRARKVAEQTSTDATMRSYGGASAMPATTSEAQSFADNQVGQPPEYEPAETWDGLEYIGSDGNWRDTPAQPGDAFQAWIDTTPMVAQSRDELVSCLHQAFIECFTCQQAGLDPSCTLHMDPAHYADGDFIDAFAFATISDSHPGQVRFASEAQGQKVVELFATVAQTLRTSTQGSAAAESDADLSSTPAESSYNAYDAEPDQTTAESPQRSALYYKVQDDSFLSIKPDMEDKIIFTIIKRFSQLSGHRVPDPILNTMCSSRKSFSHLVDRLFTVVVQPKPKKVADILMSRPGLSGRGNVMIFPRRETSVDKEKEVGRWKVIEKELQDRGLPVFGTLKA